MFLNKFITKVYFITNLIVFILYHEREDLFRSKKFLDFDNVALSFLFNKHYPIME